MKWRLMSLLALLCAMPAMAQTSAQSTNPPAANEGWQFDFTPFAWYAGIKGSVRDDSLPEEGVSIEQKWSDVFAKLERALMGTFEVRYNRWGAIADAVDYRIRGGGTVTGGREIVSLSAEGSLAQKFYTVAALYRARTGGTPIDILAGGRYTLTDWSIDITLVNPPFSTGLDVLKSNASWIDPFVGARIQKPVSKRWLLTGSGDIGGFGVGSRLSMQGQATARFSFTDWFGGNLGYRAISEDYEDRGFKYDVVNAGPMLGLSFRW